MILIPPSLIAPQELSSLWKMVVSDLIARSSNAYIANGNINGVPAADFVDQQTLQDLANWEHPVTSPGFVTLSVYGSPFT